MEPPGASWKRQTRATVGTAGALIIAASGWTAWRETGSRLAAFLCFAALLAIMVDLLLAVVATRLVTAAVSGTPANAFVGDHVPFTLSLAGPRLHFQARGFKDAEFVTVTPPASGRLPGFADRREVVTQMEMWPGPACAGW